MEPKIKEGDYAVLVNMPSIGQLFKDSEIEYSRVMSEHGFVNGTVVELTGYISKFNAFVCMYKGHRYNIPFENLVPKNDSLFDLKIGDLVTLKNEYGAYTKVILVTRANSITDISFQGVVIKINPELLLVKTIPIDYVGFISGFTKDYYQLIPDLEINLKIKTDD